MKKRSDAVVPAPVDGREAVQVEVAAGFPDEQAVLRVCVPAGSTLEDAVRISGILDRFPRLREVAVDYAVHGVRADPHRELAAGDRVELLRALSVDPRESRRRRARRGRRR